jgi:hypothetical protein
MTPESPASQNTSNYTPVLRVYFTLVIIGGLLTLGSILQIPTEAKNVVIFGLSGERLLMIVGILTVILGAVGILLSSWVRKPFFTRFERRLTAKIQQKTFWGWSILLCSLILFGSAYLITLSPEITEPFTQAYFVRMQPLITWAVAICAQSLIVLPLLRFGFDLQPLKPKSRVAFQIGSIFAFLLLLWILIAQTQLGLTRSDAGSGWNDLGTPLLETQAFAAWMVALLYIGLALWGENHPSFLERARQFSPLRIDLVASILLWLAAFAIWNSVPLTPNWYAAPPRVPNKAIYPNSDAYMYDTTGQTLLTGEGLKTHDAPFAIRPLYALFLAGMHALGGPDYEPIIWMQVAVLALLPVLLYWITLSIHNRVSALVAGASLIFRETNAIILGGSITSSHSKLLMADLPTTLGVMLLILLIIRWLQSPTQRQTLTLIAGGLTGAFMLIRPEFAVLLPFLGLAALLELNRQARPPISGVVEVSASHVSMRKKWFTGMLLITAGTVLFLLPWIWRNYQFTGTIFLDSPHYRGDLFALRYQEYTREKDTASEEAPESIAKPVIPTTQTLTQATEPTAGAAVSKDTNATPTPHIAYQPGENAEDFANRMFNNALDYAKNNLGEVLYFITNHFLNSQVQSVLYLPASFRLPDSAVAFMGHKDSIKFWGECCSSEGYIRRLPFWFKWDGELPRQSILPLALNLFLISVGLAIAWKQGKFIALLPLFSSLGYTLINALVRNSGGRYILPIDWFGIFYFSIGLGQSTLWVLAYFRDSELPSGVLGERQPQPTFGHARPGYKTTMVIAALILLLGSLLPLSEKIIPKRYPPDLQIKRQNQVLSTLDFPLEAFLAEGGHIVHGRAIYPRFHKADQGEAGTNRTPFSPLPFQRLDFYMVGPFNGGIVLAQSMVPDKFPNGADVLAIGCPGSEFFDALLVVIYDQAGNPSQIFERQPFPEAPGCPLPSP